MSVDRETVRDGLTGLLTTALVGTGLPVQAVLGYRAGTFDGKSPVVVVSSAGIEHERFTLVGSKAKVFLQVDVFVLYSDEGTWGEDDAEDALDDIEQRIYDVLDANQVTSHWQAIGYESRTQRVDVVVGGVDYIREVIQVVARVFA